MQIVYHLGAHCTDEERILRCLLANRDALAGAGILVPDPSTYRNLIRDTATALRRLPATDQTQQQVLDQITGGEVADRLILSWENFLSFPQWVLRGRMYPAVAERVRGFMNIFPSFGAEFHIGIRNPATFIPALYARQRGKTVEEFMAGAAPEGIRWSETIAELIACSPADTPVTVWCDEDTPLVWPKVLRAVAGVTNDTSLLAEHAFVESLMFDEGAARLRAELAEPRTPTERADIVIDLLSEYARPDAVEVQFDMPGWTPELVRRMTATYEEDVARIAAMKRVRFIAP